MRELHTVGRSTGSLEESVCASERWFSSFEKSLRDWCLCEACVWKGSAAPKQERERALVSSQLFAKVCLLGSLPNNG